jgi:Protein of unknown function (DUF1579)
MLRFSMLMLSLAMCLVVQAIHSAEPEAESFFNRFSGAWQLEMSQSIGADPQPKKATSNELITRELKGRYLIGRDTNLINGGKTLWLTTYDPQQKCFQWTFFNSQDLMGTGWVSTWNEESSTLTSHSSDTPPGWTSEFLNRIVNKDTIDANGWMKDDKGKSIFELKFTKTRQPEDVREKWLAAWQADPTPVPELSPELKLLDRLAGTWDVTAESKKAEWTPADASMKSKVVRTWILNRTYLQDSSTNGDGTEGLGLFTYDPKRAEYRSWWFNSEGHTAKSTGQVDKTGNVIDWKSTLPTGQTSTGSVTIIDADNHDWKIRITDATGKVYFDCVWHCVRAK